MICLDILFTSQCNTKITVGFKADGVGHKRCHQDTWVGRRHGGLTLLRPVVEVHGAQHRLVIALLGSHAGAVLQSAARVGQIFRCVPETVVVAVVQGFPQVGGHDAPGGSVGDTAAGAARLVQGAAHVGRATPGLLGPGGQPVPSGESSHQSPRSVKTIGGHAVASAVAIGGGPV